ncbi:MAG: glycosyltransferase family 39 protein [Amaricoccus sp.]|uniref:ArnT family glycosyltransferase n=1 Tax=Amaricoccus sp. TaxID=1872485 RepID=UPI0039E4A531
MPTRRPADPTRAFALGLIAIAAITLWRVALLPFDRADLFVDDAQYWFWGQELAWGYYSKPPLIAWIIRASTTIGSDAPFWIRLPFPLMHAATAVTLAFVARRLFGPRVGGIAGAGFATLPAVALGSLLLSTDTPLLLAFAVALRAQIALGERRSLGWAIALGAAVGIGLLAKYAMIYFPIAAAIAALVAPRARIALRDAGVAALVALLIVAPNIAWNMSNQLATLHHTADNADWRDGGLDLAGLAAFLGGQFGVAGPVFFTAYLAGLARLRDERTRYLAAMSLPILALVSVQATISGANANWAATAHLAALVLAAAVLETRPRWLATGFALNVAVCLALPLATLVADSWKVDGTLVLHRYVGQAAVSRQVHAVAQAQGLGVVVSDNRAILADLFYTLRDSGLAIYAEPVDGFPPHHYAQKHPLPPGPGEVLYVSRGEPPACRPGGTPGVEVAHWRPTQGYATIDFAAFRVPRNCWFPDG